MTTQPKASLTIDVEEYYHASNLDEILGPRNWHKLPSRVENSTNELLDIFDAYNAKGTFFTLGSTARRHPGLVREIVKRGHELASHGYGHRIVYTQSRKYFYRDVRKAKLILEQIAGVQVKGYRAPNFSIIEDVRWAYEELTRAGYLYDSSLYPVRHPRYGNVHRSIEPEIIQTSHGGLLVLPLAVYSLGAQFRLGVAGGGWWRLLPKFLIQTGLRSISRHRPLNCYLHPWEIDAGQPRYEELSALSKIRHYTGLKEFPDTIRAFLGEFGSSRLDQIYNVNR